MRRDAGNPWKVSGRGRIPVVLGVLLLFLTGMFLPPGDAAAGGWRETAAMADSRFYHTATLLGDGRVLVTGGQRDTEEYPDCLDGCEIYDPSGEAWLPAEKLPGVRALHTATLRRDGRVLAAGGQDRFGEIRSCCIYDPAAGTWTAAADLRDYRMGHTATLLGDGRVLVAGGIVNVGSIKASAEIFDPLSGTWSPAGDMKWPRGWHTATLLPDGRVLVFGGWSGRGPQNTAEIFDPLSGTWSEASFLEGRPLFWHTATLLPAHGGMVLVAGENMSGGDWKAVHVYSVAANAWFRDFSAMIEKRSEHTATLLPDGTVLLAGGHSMAGYAQSERFDPSTLKFVDAGPMAVRSSGHTATLLPGGTVLVAGGKNRYGSGPLSRAEIYSLEDPFPFLEGIEPVRAAAGTPGIRITLSGSGFTPRSRVLWNGRERVTAFSGPRELSAVIPAEDLARQGEAAVTVFTPPPGGGTSRESIFSVMGHGRREAP